MGDMCLEKIKKFWREYYLPHKDEINSVCTIILTGLTLILIFATYSSVKATNRIGDIEMLLAKEREKQDIRENIAIANNLIIELRFNEDDLMQRILTLYEIKDTEKSRIDKLETTRLYQAKDKVDFGTPELRVYLKSYQLKIIYIKNSLESIKYSGGGIKQPELIDSVIDSAENLLFVDEELRLKIDSLVTKISDYKESQKEKYIQLGGEISEELIF